MVSRGGIWKTENYSPPSLYILPVWMTQIKRHRLSESGMIGYDRVEKKIRKKKPPQFLVRAVWFLV